MAKQNICLVFAYYFTHKYRKPMLFRLQIKYLKARNFHNYNNT